MGEITFQVQHDESTGRFSASWDAPDGSGGIATQGDDLRDLQVQLMDAVSVHFDEDETPSRVRLHFVNDPILIPA
jgi:hypothetical protein